MFNFYIILYKLNSMTDHHKFQKIMKRAFDVVSTFKKTPWYNETNGTFQKITEIEDINVNQAPEKPKWSESSLNSTTMTALGFDLSDSDFAPSDSSFTKLHLYDDDTETYKDDGGRFPGMYLDESVNDSSGVVALFVRLKLVAISDPDICSNSISYTAYSRDTSENLILKNAYEFNYNSQLNVSGGIEVFKPYNYTLEYYSSNDSSFNTVDHSDGNWTFDNETGIITFEDDPSLNNSIIDLSNGDLYFTFVKYVGVQGLDNLLFYKNGKIGIGTQEPQSELDMHGSMGVTGDVTVKNDLKIDTNVLHINSTEKKIGINTSSPETTLDVSGSAYIDGSLNINNGIGPGFYPIGSIIMWPTDTFHNDYGTWLLCDGSGVAANDYPDLSNVLSSSSGTVYLPNFTDRYVKSADTDISYSGDISSSHILNVNNLPDHTHESSHDHDICGQLHSHSVTRNHGVDLGDHYHNISDHYHNITDNGHTHNITNTHSHPLTESQHTHDMSDNAHIHGVNHGEHHHEYDFTNITYNTNVEAAGGNSGLRLRVSL